MKIPCSNCRTWSRERTEFTFFLLFSLPSGHYISTGLTLENLCCPLPSTGLQLLRPGLTSRWEKEEEALSLPLHLYTLPPPSPHPLSSPARSCPPSLFLLGGCRSGFRRSERRAPCSSPAWELKCTSAAPGSRAPERPAEVEGRNGALSFGGPGFGPSGLRTARRRRAHCPPAWPAQRPGVREPDYGREHGGGQPGAEGRVPSGLARRRAPPDPSSARRPRRWPAEPGGPRVLSASSPRRGACLRPAAPPRPAARRVAGACEREGQAAGRRDALSRSRSAELRPRASARPISKCAPPRRTPFTPTSRSLTRASPRS